MKSSTFENLTHLNISQYVEIKNIVIPIIQRDYAQGRENEVLRRNAFLTTIFNALKVGKEIDLDFVYGEIKGNDFIPIDGQQRLTTIYLLYYYIAVRENRYDDFEKLPKLTYRTRFTSKQFFDYLRDNKLVSIKVEQKPSDWISRQPWYFSDYAKDHSVKAVINMLDAIHKKYSELPIEQNQRYYDNLSKIRFSIYPINGGISSDALYVRMNARGEQLSNFENFKAKIEEKLRLTNNELSDRFSTESTVWQDEFWQILKGKKGIPNDKNLYAFIRWMFVGLYIKLHDNIENKTLEEEILKNLIGTQDSEYYGKEIPYYSYEDYFEWGSQDNASNAIYYIAKNIRSFLDEKSENGENRIISKRRNYSENKELDNSEKSEKKQLSDFEKYSQPNIVWLIAILRFYCTFLPEVLDVNKERVVNNWARTVNNLVDNQQIDGSKEVYDAIKSIYAIIESMNKTHNTDVLHWLKETKESDLDKYRGFKLAQLKEEKQKAELILSNSEFENPIKELEEIGMLRGNIGFALDLSKGNDNAVDLGKLKKYAKLSKDLFDYIEKESRKNEGREYLFERALFTKGDYTWSKDLLVKDIYNRDVSYKRLLNHKIEEKRNCIINAIKDIERKYLNFESNIDKCLVDIINAFIKNTAFNSLLEQSNAPWRYLFITEPALFAYSNKGLFCYFDNKNKFYLPKSTNCMKDSPELYSYYFYARHKGKFGLTDLHVENYIVFFSADKIKYRVNQKILYGENELREKFVAEYESIDDAEKTGIIEKVQEN